MPKPPTLPYDDTPEEAKRRAMLIEDWATVHHWMLEEAVCLAWNIEPRLQPIIEAFDEREHLTIAARHLITRAARDPILGETVSPMQFIEWAQSMGIAFHDDWLSAIPADTPREQREDTLKTIERLSLLKMIYGMACQQYGYEPAAQRNEAVGHIAADLDSEGVHLDPDTIRKWLRAAVDEVGTTKRETD